MRFTFVSNYINHHQIPFCEEMTKLLPEGEFVFLQTEEMESERKNMGWGDGSGLPPYVRTTYRTPEERAWADRRILESDVVLFGGCEDESYIRPRLEAGKLTIRYSERVYKSGQWKFITPRGLLRKWQDHTKYRSAPVYLLCSGAYVASDFGIFGAYPGKMLRWGYFPELKEEDPFETFRLAAAEAEKASENREGRGPKTPVKLLWAGRFLDWKHPELALLSAAFLKTMRIPFRLKMIGGGPEEEHLRKFLKELSLTEEDVEFAGYKTPAEVRKAMEEADIYLFTSDRNEGWGVVLNEAMNAGCAVVADSMIGAVPFLLKNGENGMVYPKGNSEALMDAVAKLAVSPSERLRMGKEAYRTVTETWNPRVAAERLLDLVGMLQSAWGICDGDEGKPSAKPAEDLLELLTENRSLPKDGPCSVISPERERKISKRAAKLPAAKQI